MKVLIVGATGTLGRQIARQALDKKHEVRCLVRSLSKASFLREWGAELLKGDLCQPETLPKALEGIDAVIDVASARPTDSIKKVDWDGKINLIQATKTAGVERYLFFSILNAEKYPNVPLMEIKRCTEEYLAESGLKYTILRPCGFMQGLISQYAVPILDDQAVWITGQNTPIAFMDTQDAAKFAIRALEVPETEQQRYPLAGVRGWNSEEIIALCEKLSDKTAKTSRIPLGVLQFFRKITRLFQWTYNISDRLAFAEVLASGQGMTANMDSVYQTFGLDPKQTTTLESYLQEYFGRMLKKLKELDYEKQKTRRKSNSFFK